MDRLARLLTLAFALINLAAAPAAAASLPALSPLAPPPCPAWAIRCSRRKPASSHARRRSRCHAGASRVAARRRRLGAQVAAQLRPLAAGQLAVDQQQVAGRPHQPVEHVGRGLRPQALDAVPLEQVAAVGAVRRVGRHDEGAVGQPAPFRGARPGILEPQVDERVAAARAVVGPGAAARGARCRGAPPFQYLKSRSRLSNTVPRRYSGAPPLSILCTRGSLGTEGSFLGVT